MPSSHIRFDNLPMNRQVGNPGMADAGKSSPLSGGAKLPAVYEKRDIDPESLFLKRRKGSVRSATATPNLLGVTVDVNEGEVYIDEDFSGDLTADKWSLICTVRITAGATQNAVYPIARLQAMQAQIEYDQESALYSLVWRSTVTGNALQTLPLGAAGDYRIAMGRLTASSRLAKWNLDNTGYVHNTLANQAWLEAESTLRLLGPIVGTTLATLEEVVITNFQFYDQTEFTQSDYQTFAADLTPATSGTTLGETVSVATDLFTSIDDWTVGTGDVGSWTAQGATGENFRANRTDPHSNTSVIWVGSDEESGNVFDGGFNTPTVTVDPTKSYRYSVWCKQPSTAGSFMWGFANGPRKAVDTSASTNYFRVGIDLPTNDTWYLVVAYLRPHDYSGTTNDAETGIWSIGGTQYEAINFDDLKWNDASDTSAQLRTAWYANPSDASEEVEFWNPRLELVDGNQASVSELLNPPSSTPSLNYKLLWHENFSEGGDVFAYTNSDTETIASYLVPTNPTVDGDEITFGGGGIIEVPFYLDFDEYYWTPINASARYEWMFQLELKLPNRPLQAGVVFEFQDICRLEIVQVGNNFYFKSFYANSGEVQNTRILTAGGHYNVFAGRDVQNMKLGVQPIGGALTSVSSSAPFPAVFNYDQTLSFIIGDRVDVANTAPFKGRIIRFALHNNADYTFSGLGDAVVYYDTSSVYGDQIIDRGNRALNSYLGTRMSSAPPYYMQGGFPGGSYVAATGGYLMSSSSPSDGYSGELRKSIKKDAVVQRRGNKSFLTSNGVSYVIDDFDQTFRPLGIPRPGTKVTCLPQGVGPIDGFVRYAYRFVTKDGTVGPAFDLDPVDARGGVNVFLGAESFGLPGETPFGISYGRCEGYDEDPTKGLASTETVEHFLFRDTDGSGQHNLTYGDLDGKGRTLELAVRFSEFDKFRETVFSQGVTRLAPGQTSTSYQRTMGCYNAGEQFPWLAQNQRECCFQFAFRYSHFAGHQILFRVGANDQHYETGGGSDHYRLNQLVVSVQPATDYPGAQPGDNLLVVCRDAPSGSNHRDNDLYQQAFLYNFQDGHDYCVFVRRAGNYVGQPTGSSLRVHVYDHTVEQAGGDGWAWTDGSGDTEKVFNNFWGVGYSGAHPGRRHVAWGMGRLQDSWTGYRTRIWNLFTVYNPATGTYSQEWTWGFANMKGLHEASVLYHGRMWRRDFPFTLLANKALERYAGRNGPLNESLEVDIGFCRDTSKTQNEYGWDAQNELPCPFKAENTTNVEPYVVITDSGNSTPCLAYGWDMAKPAGSWSTDERNKIPMWIEITDRNDGSLAIGTGKEVAVEISSRKWWQGADTQTFDEFAGVIDLEEFTWLTLYFQQYQRPGTTEDILDLYLERVFIDGNTGEWGETFSGDPSTPINKNPEPSKGPYQYGLFTVGGFPALDQKYDVDIAEVRMWDGERYSAEGGGEGDETFGPYLSTRVPPNEWSNLIYYARFMKPDLDDEDTPTAMDQVGTFEFSGGFKQQGADAVYVRQGASVLDALDDSDSTTTQYFVPFPEPPESSIRGIQIFRTQIVPVVDDFQSGQPNPDAVSDAWRACRDAPLYFLSEIPRGNTSYTDTSSDGILGSQLEATTGLVPRNPGGIFEWKGYLGIFDTTQPRVYFAESPASWESFPLENLYDLPVREDGPIRAAIELASRDARNSRVLLLGKSYGVFLDGTPLQPVANTMGGGVGAWSQRCLVVEKGIAYAYNGTLWAITGDGQAEDIGLPVLDLLPPPDSARLSVSSSLGSLFVINEETGIALRFHFARRQWYVEDRSALSCTDVDGVDQWVHRSGYPSAGSASVYQDDVVADTPATKVIASSWNNAANTVTLASATGVEVGMRMTLVNDRQTGALRLNPAIRQTVTVASIAGNVVTVEEDLDIQTTWTDVHGDTHSVRLHAYLGVGYWGTMIDTGPFKLRGDLKYVDVGVDAGDDWWGAVQGSDYPADPANRSGFVDAESAPTSIVDEGGSGVSTRLGVNNNQRYERVLFWSPVGQAVGLTELELSYTTDPGEDR